MPRHGDNYWLEKLGVTVDTTTNPALPALRTSSGGGGGGGATTIADGADVTQGANADAAVASGATGTISAKLRSISRDLTNGDAKVQGNVASGVTDSGNPVKTGGVYKATPSTLTDGQRGDVELDTRENLKVTLHAANTVTPITNKATNADAQAVDAAANHLGIVSRNTVFNGSTWDRARGNTFGTFQAANSAKVTIRASSAATTSSNTALVDVTNYREAVVFLNVTAASGTTPTLNVKIQTSDDGGTTWYDLPNASFTQATAVTSQAIQINNFGDTLRAVSTIAGTTPSFTYAIKLVGK